ncbi:HD domain-containing protein [Nonomuraea maritima]|uniref:HD domain-containing protein n=2 Tax=Nonomuraea maritima TaxID=683260 RepID=A0A1G9H5C8_9ACTN|nr:HD domain-containing protein [Nonomuraea maritima]
MSVHVFQDMSEIVGSMSRGTVRRGPPTADAGAMAETIAGITIPDTKLVREVTEYIRDTEDDLLYHHSRRVFLFGALQGRVRGLRPDLELLYTGAMFHDIGLTEGYRESHLRFEVDGANAARDFLRQRGVTDGDVRKVWLGIALHTTPAVPEFLDPEIALVTAGVETDVLGIGYENITVGERAEVTTAHPRPDFKKRILKAFTEGNIHRPETTFGNVNADVLEHYMAGFQRTDFVKVILDNRWPE